MTASDAKLALSDAGRAVWAKSPDKAGAWLPLWQHMDDAADIAGFLFDTWASPHLRELLAANFHGDKASARTAVRFCAGAHDLGKATPAFAVQSIVLAQRMGHHGLYVPPRVVDRELAHHSLAGHHLLIRWLVETHGFAKPVARTWGVVLGAHHGAPPDAFAEQVSPRTHPDLYGEGRWQDIQRELITRVATRTGATPLLDSWRDLRLTQEVQVLLTGLVIISDWIASNQDLCPYLPTDLPPVKDDSSRAARARRRLALPPTWAPPSEDLSGEDLIQRRFDLPAGATPRPVQVSTVTAVRELAAPGLVVVEAPMGEGKTEAALAAAEVAARRWGLSGVFVALPSQATADAMFARVLAWLDRMPGRTGQQVGSTMTLSHGKARLNREFAGMLDTARLREIDPDDPMPGSHAVTAHAWLTGRKKSQLADFVVGTIDQLLFAGLKARHLMLRHLSLANKVVIIDEVHAYDVFMSSYLVRVLTWLGAYGIPVIALSATLPAGRRQVLIDAYRAGQRDSLEPADDPNGEPGDIAGGGPYPVVTAAGPAGARSYTAEPSGRATTVELHLLPDDDQALLALLQDALVDGGCALVVRNTVRRAQATARLLDEVFGADHVTVAHSRFIAADRTSKDEWLLDSFGSPQHLAARGVARPTSHIVVGTQVVEQSLDIDFDILVTDIAPVDLILQRMGRLHRHHRGNAQRDRPEWLRTARCYLTGVDPSTSPPTLDSGARKVYGAHTLYRAAAVLWPRLGGELLLPDDIAPLVQEAYESHTSGPDAWQVAMAEAAEKAADRERTRTAEAEVFQIQPPAAPGRAFIGWVAASAGETDDDAQGQGQVRDEAPSLEVIVVEDADGQWWTPRWITDRDALPVPQDSAPDAYTASAMSACTLRLPLDFSNKAAETALWVATPDPWEHVPAIYRLPVLVLDESGSAEVAGTRLRYTASHGLEVLRDDD